MVQRAGRARFPLESNGAVRFARNRLRQILPQPRVARALHLSHTPGADLRKDFIRAQFIAGRERHSC